MRSKVVQYCLLVFVLALVVRVAWIDAFPTGLWMDEGLNGVDAWYTLHDAPEGRVSGWQIVYPDLFPREPLLVWILSIALWLGGPKVVVMRLTMALLGSLSCAAFFLMVRAVEPKRGARFALVAGFVLATLHWHAHFSRIVFRTNLVPLVAALLVLAMAMAARSRGRRHIWAWLGAGAVAGVGFYTYLAWYFFMPVAAVWLWVLLKNDAEEGAESTGEQPAEKPKSGKMALTALVVGAVLILSPLLTHYARTPSDLTGRPQAVSPLRDGWRAGAVLMLRNLRDVGLMFSVRGDHVILHNVAVDLPAEAPDFGKTGTPVFDVTWSLLFYLGLIGALADLRAGGRRRRVALAWLAWLFCMSMPSVTSQTDSANTLRNLGVTPAVAFFVASGWWWIWTWARARFQGKRLQWGIGVCMALLIWGAGFQVYKEWVRHPRVEGIRGAFSDWHVQMARMSRALSAEGDVVYVPTDFYYHKTFEFLTLGAENIRPMDLVEAISRPTTGGATDSLLWITAVSPGNLGILKSRFPSGGVVQELRLNPTDANAISLVYRVPARALLDRAEAERFAASVSYVEEH